MVLQTDTNGKTGTRKWDTPVETHLFQTYGKVVARLFDTSKRVALPFALFPSDKPSVTHTEPDHLVRHIPPEEWKRTQETIDYLRQTLQSEQADRSGRGSHQPGGSADAGFYLRAFQKALESGQETLLDNNPFYELSRLIFRHNLSGARNLLKQNQSAHLAQALAAVPFFDSYRKIRTAPQTSFFARTGLMLGKSLMGLKGVGVTLLSLISVLLTVTAVYHLFPPAEGDVTGLHGGGGGPVLLAGGLLGVFLTLPVLAFKARLYHGMAETGHILGGVRYAFSRRLLWFFVLVLLTLTSIKTNYDGLVAVLFKTTEIAQQTAQIQRGMQTLMGSDTAQDGMDFLQSRTGQLDAWGMWITSLFQRMPGDKTGHKISAERWRRDPRYWSKYFIVHGGYAPGLDDVAHRAGNLRGSRAQDNLLIQSGFDLIHSVAQKLQKILERHKTHAMRTSAYVQEHMTVLEHLFPEAAQASAPHVASATPETVWAGFLVDMHPENLLRTLTLYQRVHQGRQILRAIFAALKTHEAHYMRTVADLNGLITASNALLARVDPKGRTQDASGRQAVRTIVASSTLSSLGEQEARAVWHVPTHFSMAQLKERLSQASGSGFGLLLLGAILLLAVAVDVGELVVFGLWITWRGRKDRTQLAECFDGLKTWEAEVSQNGKTFLDRTDVRRLLPGITFPNAVRVRNALHHTLESINPAAKDRIDQTPLEKWRLWFRGLFVPVRMADMVAYNARVQAIHAFQRTPDIYLSQWMTLLFPGVRLDRGMGMRSFADLQTLLETTIAAHKETFKREWHAALHEDDEENPASLGVASLPDKQKDWARNNPLDASNRKQMETFLTTFNLAGDDGPQALRRPSGMTQLFQWLGRAGWLDFTQTWGHIPSYSRRTWLKEKTAESQDFGDAISILHNFIPTLKETLSHTLPELQQELLDPLMAILDRLPMRCAQEGFMDMAATLDKFERLQKLTLDMLGVSQLVDPEMDGKLLSTLTNKAEIDKMSAIIQGGRGKESVFLEKINHLAGALRHTLQRAQSVEDALRAEMGLHQRAIHKTEEEVRQILMQVNMHGWEARRRRPPPTQLLQILFDNQPLFEQAPHKLATLSARAARLLEALPSETNLDLLTEWTLQAQSLVDTLQDVLTSLTMPTHIDRRLEVGRAHTAGGPPEKDSPETRKAHKKTQKGTGKSRRQSEREVYETHLEFVSGHGRCYRGASADVSNTGVRLIPAVAPRDLTPGEEGTLRLLDPPAPQKFACRVVSVSPEAIALHLLEASQGFETLLARRVVQEIRQKGKVKRKGKG